jgi:hypothetical protein
MPTTNLVTVHQVVVVHRRTSRKALAPSASNTSRLPRK